MLPVKQWRLDSLLRLGAGIFFAVALGSLVSLLFAGRNEPGATPGVWRIVAGVAWFQGAIVLLVARFVREHEMSWTTAFGFNRTLERSMMFGALGGALFLPAGLGLQWLSRQLMIQIGIEPDSQLSVKAIAGASGWLEITAFTITTVLLAPLAEELLFRGVLYPAIKRGGYRLTAWFGQAALFALIHSNIPTALPLFAFALLLTLLYEKTGNLAAPITAHAAFNAINLAALYLEPEFQRRVLNP